MFSIKSSYELFCLLREIQRPNTIASIDVTFLFINATINETIKIILCNAYNHPHLPPLEFTPDCIRELLVMCTTSTPFRNIHVDIYFQKKVLVWEVDSDHLLPSSTCVTSRTKLPRTTQSYAHLLCKVR